MNGDYKFIFAQNEKLHTGDTIYVNYESKRYAYRITTKEVVMPEEVSKLVYPTDKPVLTLVSCVPLGTALKRLLITAEQVSPDPTAAATAPTADAAPKAASIPGSEPTFLERIFGGGR
ncbi:Sortase family protein [compost metagenome]